MECVYAKKNVQSVYLYWPVLALKRL